MYFQEYHAPGLSAEVCNAWQEAADMFDKAGAKVTQVSLPFTQYSINCYVVLNCCEVASNMARYDGIEFGKYIFVLLFLGLYNFKFLAQPNRTKVVILGKRKFRFY